MKAEKIKYVRSSNGNRSETPCPHGGSWYRYDDFVQIHRPGERSPANVGTNGCAHCIFHKNVEVSYVECLFLKADQRFVDRALRKNRQ